MNITQSTNADKPRPPAAGILLTLFITIFFGWAVVQLFTLSTREAQLTQAGIRSNEIRAYQNMAAIVQAQQKYIHQDHNRDGKKEYAMFYVHLWTTVTPRSEPILLEYIPKRLAFAMDANMHTQGYYYKNLYKRFDAANNTLENDYSRQWSVVAHPAIKGRTGEITFIVDQSQRIYATQEMYTIPVYPHEPLKRNWTLIDSVKTLETYQQKVQYQTRD